VRYVGFEVLTAVVMKRDYLLVYNAVQSGENTLFICIHTFPSQTQLSVL
jgi:hypothetical protein